MLKGAMAAGALLALWGTSAAKPEPGPLPLRKGLPKKSGLGRLVILTNYPGRDGRFAVLKTLAAYRKAKILRIPKGGLESIRKPLARIGPEFVALAVTPETVDINTHYEVLELCRNLDRDPMPDFSFGYLCAANGKDLQRLVDGIRRREARRPEAPVAKIVPLKGDGTHIAGLDFLMHFGHGQAWCVVGGMKGEQVGALDLPRGPVVWSGACFNGVLSRSYHPCAYQLAFSRPVTIAPERLMTLNWVKAGVTGYFAALEGDRGEMAMAEWDHFRSSAGPLGETMTHQYRLAFTSLPADFRGFPRYRPGVRKRMAFYDVMLRGQISRILLSDPAYRPLARPLDPPANVTEVVHEPKGKTLEVRATARHVRPGSHLNYLPKSRRGVFDARIYVRVELPPSVGASPLGEAAVALIRGGREEKITRSHVRSEVWGGRRFLNLQVEAPRIRVGDVARFRFAVR